MQDDIEKAALADWKLVELEIHNTSYQTSDSGPLPEYGFRGGYSFP